MSIEKKYKCSKCRKECIKISDFGTMTHKSDCCGYMVYSDTVKEVCKSTEEGDYYIQFGCVKGNQIFRNKDFKYCPYCGKPIKIIK